MSVSESAARTPGEAAYTILARANELERAGKSIIHFEIGQPDFETPPSVVDEAINALRSGKTKYTPSLGIPELRDEVARYVTRTRGVQVAGDRVAITPSAKTGLFLAMAAVLNPGDEVIYPDPGFPAYENIAAFLGAVPVPVPLLEKNNFSLDIENLKKLVTAKTKLIILNSPSNPTGSIIARQDLLDLAAFARAREDLYILTDEIYSDILYDGIEYPTIYNMQGMASRTFLVSGFSKSYSMTGWRLGYIVAPSEFLDPLDRLSVNFFASTAHFTQCAGVVALTKTDAEVKDMVASFKERRDFLVPALNSLPGVTCHMPQGAFYVFPNITGTGMGSEELADALLAEAGVSLLPGTAFGRHGEGYLRLSYATSLENITEGVKRMRTYLGARA